VSAVAASANVSQSLVVIFDAAVERPAAESILSGLGLRRIEHPDLLPNHWMVETTIEQAFALAEREEVAYLFPASEELLARVPVQGCAGPVAPEGLIAQYVSTVGSGWDGPSRGRADLTYTITRGTEQLAREQLVSTIERALGEWSRHARIRFTYYEAQGARGNISFVFGAGSHGDAYPFDGRGHVLAHTFYPAGVNPEPLAGDIHLDDDEAWHSATEPDLYSVILHELGHALGLGHADRPGAVMYPYYRRAGELQPDDIAALRRLYAAPEPAGEGPVAGSRPAQPLALTVAGPLSSTTSRATVSGTITGGTAPYELTWLARPESGALRTASAWSIHVPAGVVELTVRDSAGGVVRQTVTITRVAQTANPSGDRTGPSLQIQSPAGLYSTSAASVSVAGTARDSSGVREVTWSSTGGGAGIAVGTATWRIESVPLLVGDNTITITAMDEAGNTSRRKIQVTRR
jgi:hypothetical protein